MASGCRHVRQTVCRLIAPILGVYSLCVCMCVHARALSNSRMDLLLNSAHRAGEYDVEKCVCLSACVCKQSVCV